SSASTLPSYVVTQEGLTQDDGQRLADAFGIPNAVEANGAFAFVDRARFEQVPQTKVGEGTDEVGRRTVSQALNLSALSRIRPLSDDAALARAAKLLDGAGLSPDLEAKPTVSHSELTIADREGRTQLERPLDTQVTFQLSLG